MAVFAQAAVRVVVLRQTRRERRVPARCRGRVQVLTAVVIAVLVGRRGRAAHADE